MDPASFAIGVVSLASIVSTCIEGFQIVQSIRGYEHDAHTVMLKLEIERALFIQWAFNVGLLQKHYVNVHVLDSSSSPETDQLVHNVLVKIKQLLNQAETLARKYGLIQEDQDWKSCFDSNINTYTNTNTNTKQITKRDKKQEWCCCNRHDTKHRHRDRQPELKVKRTASSPSPSLSRRFMWTIHAKEAFESLIRQLHYFIQRLGQMVKSVGQRQMLLKDLRGLDADFSKLDLIDDTDTLVDFFSSISSSFRRY